MNRIGCLLLAIASRAGLSLSSAPVSALVDEQAMPLFRNQHSPGYRDNGQPAEAPFGTSGGRLAI
jgi:hypothetical protein